MISNEVTKFMAIVPLMLPRLIDNKRCVDPDITEDTAVLYFKLDEPFPIGCIMDMLDENVELHLLYHGSNKTDDHFHHCCFFASPKLGHCMFSINMTPTRTLSWRACPSQSMTLSTFGKTNWRKTSNCTPSRLTLSRL